jgi:hypothetical protein
MKHSSFAYVIPVGAGVGVLVLSLMAFAGFLSGDWGTIFACTPAILVTIGIVACLASGVIFFGTEEDETAEEAAHAGGAALFDGIAGWIETVAHRTADRLHVHRFGH